MSDETLDDLLKRKHMRRFIWSVGFFWLALLPLQKPASAVQDPAIKPAPPADPSLFRQMFVQRAHTDAVVAVAFSPDGKKVISGGRDLPDNGRSDGPPNIRIWDANTGQVLLALRTAFRYDGSVGFSPDGKRFVSYATTMFGDAGPATQIRDATNGQPLVSLQPWARSLAFGPDGKHILGCNSKQTPQADTRVALWDAVSGRITRNFSAQLTEPNEFVHGIAFSPDGKKFATTGEKPGGSVQIGPGINRFAGVFLVRVWDPESGKVTLTKTLPFVVRSLAFGPDGKVIVAGHDLNLAPPFTAWVKIFDATTGRETLSLKTPGTGAHSVCCSADGKRIVSGYYDGTIRIWDVETGKELAILRGHMNVVFAVAISPDGTKIASGGSDGTFRIWGIPANQQPQPK